MIWQEITVTTIPEAADAVANLFHEMGFGGVVIEDPQLVERYTRTAGWDCYALPPKAVQGQHISIKGYFPLDPRSDVKKKPLSLPEWQQRIQALLTYFNGAPSWVRVGEVKEEDWAHAWKKYYHPLKVTEKIVIKPTWEAYAPLAGETVIELDPGMAFGTGMHPTTLHCIRALEERVQAGDQVIDVGTGTGILAIAAVKLGAAKVMAIEQDAMAADIAWKNIVHNGVAGQIGVLRGDLLAPVKGIQADLIVANLVTDIIQRLVPKIPEKLKPGGYFIGAGINQGRVEEVIETMLKMDFRVSTITEEGEWSTITVQKG